MSNPEALIAQLRVCLENYQKVQIRAEGPIYGSEAEIAEDLFEINHVMVALVDRLEKAHNSQAYLDNMTF